MDPLFVAELEELRRRSALPPDPAGLGRELLASLAALLFPQHARSRPVAAEVELFEDLLSRLISALAPADPAALHASVSGALPALRVELLADAAAIFEGDPAASSLDEVVLTYPGFSATVVHRFAHLFYEGGAHVLARLLSELSHSRTGVDIHPGARIGPRFALDHATGVVVGETAVVGADVRLYQGVTLGALRVERSLRSSKRHPTVGDRVTIYANATILGGSTVVGSDSVVGGNVWLTRSVPPGSIVSSSCEVSGLSGAPEDLGECRALRRRLP